MLKVAVYDTPERGADTMSSQVEFNRAMAAESIA